MFSTLHRTMGFMCGSSGGQGVAIAIVMLLKVGNVSPVYFGEQKCNFHPPQHVHVPARGGRN